MDLKARGGPPLDPAVAIDLYRTQRNYLSIRDLDKERQTTMPSNKNINSYLEEIKKDQSKALLLSIGPHKDVATGTKIPKAGMSQSQPKVLPSA
jgi:hypothetical protein